MPGLYERELDELYRLRRQEERRKQAAQRLIEQAELQELWEACEVVADAHELRLQQSGLPMPGSGPGSELDYEADRISAFGAVSAKVIIPLDIGYVPPGTSWD